MKHFSWEGNVISGMIRTLEVNCTQVLECSKNDGKTPAETDSNEMVIGAVRALCEFSLLVSEKNHSVLSLTALDNAVKQFNKKMGAFRDKKISNSAKAKVNDQLARESDWLQKQKIHKIRTAMEVLVYGAENFTTST